MQNAKSECGDIAIKISDVGFLGSGRKTPAK